MTEPDHKPAQILRSHCPSQLPQHFKIIPQPNNLLMADLFAATAARQTVQLVETHIQQQN